MLLSKSYAYQVISRQHLSTYVICLRLQATNGIAMPYKSGQFLSIALADGDFRCYSMASPYTSDGLIELHIRLHETGKFSNYLKYGLTTGDTLSVSGPYGDCIWPSDLSSITHTVMLATGTGIAPLKAMIENLINNAITHTVTLICAGEKIEDIYLHQYFAGLAEENKYFQFIPILSTQPLCNGKPRLIQETASQMYPDMSTMQVFACGNPNMVKQANHLLIKQNKLKIDNFHADAFEASQNQAILDEKQNQEKITLKIHYPDASQSSLKIDAGKSLMAALQENNVIRGVCGGHAICGTCCVQIHDSWLVRLTFMNRSENRLLQALMPNTANYRLACQIQLENWMNGLEINVLQNNI